MSSSETIDELRQKRDEMQADINGMKADLATRQKRVADFESKLASGLRPRQIKEDVAAAGTWDKYSLDIHQYAGCLT